MTTQLRTLTAIAALILFCLGPAGAAPKAAKKKQPPTVLWVLTQNKKAEGVNNPMRGNSAFEVVYTISAGGLSGTMSETQAPPRRTRMEIKLGPIHEIDVDSGADSWQQDSTGNIRTVSGDELTENRMAISFSIENFDPVRDKNKGKVVLHLERDPDSGDYIVDFIPKKGPPQTVYIDSKTFLRTKTVMRKGGLAGTIAIRKYKNIDGAKIPSSIEIGYAGLPVVILAELESAKPLASVDPLLFKKPDLNPDWSFLTEDGAREATVPFDFAADEIMIPVEINGKRLNMILDSGAGSSFITATAAERVGLKGEGQLPSLGYGGMAHSGIAPNTTVELPGALRLTNLSFYIVADPAGAQSGFAKAKIDGAIGFDVFSRLAVWVDYAGRKVTFLDPRSPHASEASPKGSVALPIRLDNRIPTIRAAVDGKAGSFVVDTGDTGTIHMFTKFARKNGFLVAPTDPNAYTSSGSGVGGEMKEVITDGHKLTLGTLTLDDIPLATSTSAGITEVYEHAGGIGNLIWQDYVLRFDYQREKLTVVPTATSPSKPHPSKKPAAPVKSSPQSQAPAARHRTRFAHVRQEYHAPEPMTLKVLMEKHVRALGGQEAIERLTATRMVAEIETGGIKGTVTTVFASPDREYESDKLGLINVTQGYDGSAAWRQDTNGNVRRLFGSELKQLRDQIFLDTVAYALPGRMLGKVTLRPAREPRTEYYIVDAEPEGGAPFTLFFDPKTFLIAKERHKDDATPVTTTFMVYRAVDGVQFPMREHITSGNARYDTAVRVTHVENNPDLPDDLFSVPAADMKAAFLTPGATTATVPFTIENDEISMPVKINGRDEHVYLDTGTSGIALSKRITDALHLKHTGYLEARGYGGSTDLHPVQIDTFEVGGAVVLKDVAAAALPLPKTLDPLLKKPLAGFIGYDLLAHFVVRIDYAAHTLTFTAPDVFTPTADDGVMLPLELEYDIPAVTAQLDDLPPARFILDTGDTSAIRLYSPYVADNNLAQKYPDGEDSVGGGIAGISRSRSTTVGSVTVAGVTVKDVAAEFSQDPTAGASTAGAGSLGSQFLSRFTLTLDYPHSRVYLKERKDAQ